MLIAYFHMWHDGEPFENQCEGCTFSTCHMQMLDYLHARGVTYAVFCQGAYAEQRCVRGLHGLRHSPGIRRRTHSQDSLTVATSACIACYLREDNQVYETYWTTGRGVEALMTSYHALDLTVYGRQENWEDSPEGWPLSQRPSVASGWPAGGAMEPPREWLRTAAPRRRRYWPTRPSIRSRNRSAWPQWRAYSSII